MRLVATLGRLAACLGLTLLTTLAAAQSSTEELQRQVTALQEELARLKAAGTAETRLAELERRIDLLAAEIEKSRTGGASAEQPLEGARGLAPAASKVYGVARGVSIGGYGEALYENFSQETESGQSSGRTDQVDFLRAIVYVGYKFSDKLLFNSETEFEHASTGKGGAAVALATTTPSAAAAPFFARGALATGPDHGRVAARSACKRQRSTGPKRLKV